MGLEPDGANRLLVRVHVHRLVLPGIWSILDAETGFERGRVVSADDFDLKYVAIVASIIGAVVLILGFVGIFINLS